MREIKFRGYSKSFNIMFDYDMLEMASAGIVDICKKELKKINPEATELQMGLFLPTYDEDLMLMQYTGLKDKNGKEIYEGDIVQHEYNGELIHTIVKFECGAYFAGDFYLYRKRNTVEVVGNIYENSDLLEGINNELYR